MTDLNALADRVHRMCLARQWSMHWTARGSYLHLEASELIEAVRGKHGSPMHEAADVLLVLMSITTEWDIPFSDVIGSLEQKLETLETVPPYAGEERSNKSDNT